LEIYSRLIAELYSAWRQYIEGMIFNQLFSITSILNVTQPLHRAFM
jgi:hypothetical protein